MSDFLSNLVERSLSGSSAVRPQLGTIYESPAEKGFSTTSEGRETIAPPPPNERIERISGIESMWQPDSEQPAKNPSTSSQTSLAGLQPPAPGLPSTIASGPHNPEPRRRKPSAQDSAQPEMEIPPPVQLAASEIRAHKVIELIRRESPRSREPNKPPEFRAIPQSLPPFRSATQRAKEREDPAPTSISVTIGRVEVRATLPQSAAPEKPRAAAPITSLDEYLRGRAGGTRR